MSMPPKDADASELWQRLSERPRPSVDIPFPGKGLDGKPLGDVKIWVLTESELAGCRASADRVARDLLTDPKNPSAQPDVRSQGYFDIYWNELQVQLVAKACRHPTNPVIPSFPSAKHARQCLTTDEFGVLAKAIATWRVESGPVVAELTKDELEAWVKLLMEGGSLVPLASLSLEALQELVRHLVSQLKTSPMANGSAGSLPDDSSSDRPDGADLVDDADRSHVEG